MCDRIFRLLVYRHYLMTERQLHLIVIAESNGAETGENLVEKYRQ